MNAALGISSRTSQRSFDRMPRGDRARTVRYVARRTSRDESPRKFFENDDVAQIHKHVLREAYDGIQAPTLAIAEDSGASKKAAENWWNGENPIGPVAFANLYNNNTAFAALARYYLLGHVDADPYLEIQMQQVASNLEGAAKQMGMHPQQLAAALQFAMQARSATEAREGNLHDQSSMQSDSPQPTVTDPAPNAAVGDLFGGE